MLKLLAFGILIWSFFQPLIAAIVFVTLIVLFEGWLLLSNIFWKPKVNTDYWTTEEQAAIRKYHLYFRYPFASRSFSSTLSGIQLSAFIWVPWLLYNRIWIPAIIIGLNYFIAAPLVLKLNPQSFFHDAVENRGNTDLLPEMMAIDSVSEKILEARKNSIEENKESNNGHFF